MEEKKIIAYKGFDKNLKCRDFQYEVGKEYEMDGDIKCCERGFHACESPLEVFDYYDMLNSRFAEVEHSGEIDKEENTTKVCSSKIKVKAELKLADIINLGVEWIKDVTSPVKLKKETDLNDNVTLLRLVQAVTLLRLVQVVTLLRLVQAVTLLRLRVQVITLSLWLLVTILLPKLRLEAG